MPAERYFIEEDLKSGITVTIDEAEFHHLSRVMRTKEGDSIEIINGKGHLAFGYIRSLHKQQAEVAIEKVTETPRDTPQIILACALLKSNKLDWVIEKGTELGASAFWLFPGNKSVTKEIFPSQQKRLLALTIASLKQCGRLYLPEIRVASKIETWEKIPKTQLLFGDLHESVLPLSLAYTQRNRGDIENVIFVSGPEAGLCEKEENQLRKIGGQGTVLSSYTLRAETAPLAAISILESCKLEERIPGRSL